MDKVQIRAAFYDALKKISGSNRSPSFGLLMESIRDTSLEKGFITNDHYFDRQHWDPISSLFWEHIFAGVLALGLDKDNPGYPWFRITEYGQRVLTEGSVVVYDPTGTIDFIKGNIEGDLDPLIEEYYGEALTCFGRGCLRAALVMVGAAAEKTLLNLAEAFVEYAGEAKRKKLADALIRGRSVKKVLGELESLLGQYKEELQKAIGRDDIEQQLSSISHMIRIDRNDQGHPKGVKPDKETALSNLILFPRLYIIADRLINYLSGPKAVAE